MMALQIHDPHQDKSHAKPKKQNVVGIDLGTTHSLIGIIRGDRQEGGVHLFADDEGRIMLPSVVAFPHGLVLAEAVVGHEALHCANPLRMVSSIKRVMGRGAEDVQALPFEIAPSQGGGMADIMIEDIPFSPVALSSLILRALRLRAERALGQEVRQAVVTVPAYFDDGARSATRDAAQLAGLEVLRLVNEPTAAALAYGLDNESEGLYIVYDLGGGTFDVSLLHLRGGVFQVRATGGDTALGGDDFDHALVHHVMGNEAKSLSLIDRKKCLAQMRELRERLSNQEQVSDDHPLMCQKKLTLTRQECDALFAPLIDKTLRLCRHVLADADVAASEIAGVVLAGGATRTPLVRERVREFFKIKPLCDFNPDEVVVRGAVAQAGALSGRQNHLLLDVAPLSLGIETMGGVVAKIIERNSPIPVSNSQEFTTWQDGQQAMDIHVLQGEREMVADNRSLARFHVTDIPPMAAGNARVKVTFTMDADGLLTVSATEQTSGTEQKIEVKPSYGLSAEKMGEMLQESHLYAAQDMSARLLAEAKVEAEQLLNALTKALKGASFDDKNEKKNIESAMAHLRKTIKENEREAIMAAVKDLDKASQPFAERHMNLSLRKALKGKSVKDALSSS